MFVFHCPHCAEKREEEFGYGGEAFIARPGQRPSRSTMTRWGDYPSCARTPRAGLWRCRPATPAAASSSSSSATPRRMRSRAHGALAEGRRSMTRKAAPHDRPSRQKACRRASTATARCRFTSTAASTRAMRVIPLASALLANGVRTVARSFKHGRRRGIVGAGPEEPNALVQLEAGALDDPQSQGDAGRAYDGLAARRTTGWPSLDFDLKSLGGHFSRFMPAGFYYKTFQSRALWPTFETIIRRAAGYGTAPRRSRSGNLRPQASSRASFGRGRRGRRAVGRADGGARGLDVLLLDEQNELGGWLRRRRTPSSAAWPQRVAYRYRRRAWALPNVTVMT